MAFQFKTKPFLHQKEEFENSRDKEAWAIFWEQGTGKSKLIIDNAAWLHAKNEIDGMLIIAPNGLHYNWLLEEIPAHLPDNLFAQAERMAFQTKSCKTQKHQRAINNIIETNKFAILGISYDALMTEVGCKTVWDFLRKRKILYIADESNRIKSPNAKRTKRAVASSVYAPYRRILTGTPMTNTPFDYYSQIRFLYPDFWKQFGINSFLGFKTAFGVWEKCFVSDKSGEPRAFPKLTEYQQLDRLREILKTITSRVTKDEVLDLPPKVYSKEYFDLVPKQRAIYNQLRDEFMTFLDDGTLIAAPLAMVRMMRLQQVTCGYLPTEDGENPIADICNENPRLDLFMEMCESVDHQALVWARFTRDIDKIVDALGPKRCVRYDGHVSEENREKAKKRFRGEDVQFFVATPSTGGEGLTLNEGKTTMYYSNGVKLLDRLQSEDRNHRIGQGKSVQYRDIVGRNTVDPHLIDMLVKKHDIANECNGDSYKEWIRD